MKFITPQYFFWLWILIPVGILLAWSIRRRRRILESFAAPDLFPILLPGHAPRRRWIKAMLLLMALALALVALAGPQWGFRWEKVHQKGVDIMIALDCSQSMMATDISPNRLERAKREIIDLMNRVTGDRVGLVAFSGQAILQCPLTLDKGAFQVFLRVLNPSYLPVGGTNIKAAIESAAAGFEAESDTEKAIILITDGENTAGDLTETLEAMARQGIRIFSIGVGDPAGAPIPHPQGGFKKDGAGNIVLSKVDMAALEGMAKKTGGVAVRSVAGDLDLEEIYIQRIKGTLEQKEWEQGKRRVWEQRFQWALLPCVLLLLWEFFLPLHRRKTEKKMNGRQTLRSPGGNLSALILIPWLGIALAAAPGTARANSVKDGVDAYAAGAFEKAKTHFIQAQLDDPEDARLYYNIGAAAYKSGDFELAQG
ncbi:MAG: VWA domain-containing protein, partial [Desulfobacterales bacterium]|nr:VWA domain-containing protein [Desulfobacterales bacterium]